MLLAEKGHCRCGAELWEGKCETVLNGGSQGRPGKR